MSLYPKAFDDDTSLIRIDDNIDELGGTAINQLRSAVFSIEKELGLDISGSSGSLTNRLDTSLNPDGTIKSSALTSVGLASLPIDDNQVSNTAGIKEIKLALDFKTADLHSLIVSNQATLDSISSFTTTINSDLLIHISGGTTLSDNSTLARHVASHIDLNNIPSDTRDPAFTWNGLLDKDGNKRSATTVAGALEQINNDFVSHQNATSDAHVATGVSVDTSNFTELPKNSNNVQKAIDAIDDIETLNLGTHRATQHHNSIPDQARSLSFEAPDGYSKPIVPETQVSTFLVRDPATSPQDNSSTGDDLVVFKPDNSGFVFDSQFSKVKVGDVIRINYGTGVEASFPVESIRFVPDNEWVVRINGVNLADSDGYTAFARIDRPLFDDNTAGVLSVATANNDIDTSILGSVIVSDPKGATAVGLGFDPNQLNSNHFKLYLQFYPNGNPEDLIIDIPAIDVTGNSGTTPGRYTIDTVVDATNNSLRAAGFNLRFIAFNHKGEFGIMLADSIDGAAFSIVNGTISGDSVIESSFTENVVGDATDGKDPLGLGNNKAGLASPEFQSTFSSSAEALLATKVIVPRKRRNYVVNGISRDDFAETFMSSSDGYWAAVIDNRNVIGSSTVEVTYKVNMDLSAAGLKAGKTLVVQPAVEFSDPDFRDVDYGRFIIKEVTFSNACPPDPACTFITVINGLHASGSATGFSSDPGLSVRLYFSEDSVGFNRFNIADPVASGNNYNRLHEIYINDEGKTFSHERARMLKQTESSSLLATTSNWNIKNVSPKLRGWRDSSSSSLNKYIRFFVLNYDSNTGEFDGYIGRRDPSSNTITNTGKITRARKNVPARFFDDTNVDFIELEFFDTVVGGVDVMSTDSPRFVDIQVFPSLALDEEFMLLATCEVDKNNIQRVRDEREFGSITELEFTESAIDFIEAGNKHLHSNGIIRGFEFNGADSSNPRIMTFSGGLALVDGKIIATNNGEVEIPEISEEGVSLPQNLDWALAVDKDGQFRAIILTDTKKQFFAAGGNYYVESVSFDELVNKRKDLTLIQVVNVTISSFALNGSNDARRFVESETLNIPLSWVDNTRNEFIGHFRSVESLSLWLNNYTNLNSTVKVRGTIDVEQTVDLSNVSNSVIFEGENATLNINVNKGFILKNNVSFKNINFNYNPSGITFTSGNHVNADVDAACLFHEGSVEDVLVDNCSFSGTFSGSQRPPYILFLMDTADAVNRLKILNNKFTDVVSNERNAVIAVVSTNSSSGSIPAIFGNSRISNNICNGRQSIVVTAPKDASPGLVSMNSIISGNICGTIGFSTTSETTSGNTNIDDIFPQHGLIIFRNTTKYIGTLFNDGTESRASLFVSTGDAVISENFTSRIIAHFLNDSSNELHSKLLIQGNTFKPTGTTGGTDDADFFSDTIGSAAGTAILVPGPTVNSITDSNALQISGNSVQRSATEQYTTGFEINRSAVISNNVISGFVSRGIAVLSANNRQDKFIITNNQFYRENNNISEYVRAFESDPTGTGATSAIVKNNFFDSPTVDGSNTELISGFPSELWAIRDNKNDTKTVKIHPVNFFIGTTASILGSDTTLGLNSFPSNIAEVQTSVNRDLLTDGLNGGAIKLIYDQGIPSFDLFYIIDLVELLPVGVKFVKAEFELKTEDPSVWEAASEVSITLRHADGSSVIRNNTTTGGNNSILLNNASNLNSKSTIDITINETSNDPSTDIRVIEKERPLLSLKIKAENTTASQIAILISSLKLTYRW